ncbi:hypothetical protein PybrP1_005934 [[Pythium] brassicae (nom. inval.)]|nr:hypothetical protein PybrP1_005934 [[Pythium] brassicae (nom. inval.)]
MAPATKRLNLSAAKQPEPAAVSSSEGDERSDAAEQTEDESDDEEFEIPPGFESVRGSAALTRDAVLSEDKELWFFKLPKHVGKSRELGEAVASVSHDGKTYQLQTEDAVLTQQLVNAFPEAADRKKFTLAKPFTRVFSLVEDWNSSTTASSSTSTSSKHKREAPAEAASEQQKPAETTKKQSKKHKSKSSEAAETAAEAPREAGAKVHKKHKAKK